MGSTSDLSFAHSSSNNKMGVISTVVLALLCFASASSTLLEQQGPLLQCQAPNISNVKVVLRTQQNRTGHWTSRVGVKQSMVAGEGGVADHWLVDVEQQTETCEDADSVLETVFYLTAPPSTRGKPIQRSPIRSVTPTTPIDWVCPRCPPPPSCPDPTPCPATTRTSLPSKSPPGYQHFSGVGFYKVSTQAETWLDARRICEQDGGHLVVINSDREADAIKTLLSHFPATPGSAANVYVLLGAQRIGSTYFTVLGEELANTGYVRWSPNEPSGGNEFCLSLYRTNNLFNDVPCSWKLGFICEHLHTA